MDSQKLGSHFEVLTRDFFSWLFNKIDLTITKERIQTSGTQDGFDVQIQISKNFIIHNIYIECKNYSSSIAMGHIFQKALELETNYPINSSNDLFIAINSKSTFKNKDNPEKTKQTLNTKFDFECQMLDISNGIKELFALNKHFYKALYEEEPNFEIDEDKIIEKFKSIIFSNVPFKKVILKEEDKITFLGNIKPQKYFINRTFTTSRNSLEYDFKRDSCFEFEEIVSDNDKIFILGNPGAGKTTSLEEFVMQYWSIGEQNGSTPIFRNLKNFTITDTIENKLPNNFDDLKNVLLVLDGIDEIADVENFISKLEDFLNSETVLNLNLKCVISCRTNIYESVVKKINGFSTFFIKDLEYYEAIAFLKTLCESPIDHLEFNEISNSFLKNPFQIKILATYLNTYNRVPTNSAILWENYIAERLKTDSSEKQKRKKFNSSLIKSQSQKVSLINELMKSNTINEDLLLEVFNYNPEHLEEFKKNPLIDMISGSSDWFYEHRNIQEYFAAKLISKQPIDNIISFIQILDKKRTHPSLFNSITFLINILDKESDKYIQLVDWLVKHEPEILFKADNDRIHEYLKIIIFQTYFQRVCIEQTLWINNNGTFQSNEIASFASCQPNYDYLISIIKDYKNQHHRTIHSALDLLKYFNIPFNELDRLKVFLINKLKEKNFNLGLKADVLRIIYIQKLTYNDEEYIKKIFLCFKNSTHKEVNRSLMNLLSELDDIEDYYDFIKEEFLLIHKIKEREIKDDVLRGSEYTINELIFKIRDPDNFLEIIKYHFIDDIRIYAYSEEELLNRVLSKITFYILKDEKYIEKLLSQIKEDFRFHTHERLLKQVIIQSNTRIRAIKYLLNSFDADKVMYFISGIINSESLNILCDKLVELKTENKEVEFWRNSIGYSSSRELSVKFHQIMEKNGVVFKEPAITEKKEKKQTENFKNHIQENFDILFDKKKLKSKIRYIFTKHGNEIDGEKIREIRSKWYQKKGNWNFVDAQIDVLDHIIFSRNNTSTNMKVVNTFFKDDFVLYKGIKSTIERYKNSNRDFEISQIQKVNIIDWSIKQASLIDFENVARASGPNSFYYLNDYKKLETIFFFENLLDFKLPKDFLLNCIRFYEFTKSDDADEEYAKLKRLIDDNEAFNQRIITNIESETLIAFSKSKHLEYAVNNNLTSVFNKVREYFLDENSMYNQSNILEKYVSLTDDIILLKECAINIKEQLTWTSIRILIELKRESDFCSKKAIQYLELNEERYRVDALQTLFALNNENAFTYLIKLLNEGIVPYFSHIKFNNFNNIKNLDDLKVFFNLIYKPEFDDFANTYRNFFNYLINFFSVKEDNFELVQSILFEIKEELETSGSDLFNINRLIHDSLDSYINSKSAIYTFNKALSTVNSLQ
ncbi:NACHT domain-containing protein [Winogradskyella wichelsiae]|uniref:NACHT domain-containing protein n=1 Tax=Winogradskyella wichelsiae TaxID=2697007 RepID=UPI003EFA02A3